MLYKWRLQRLATKGETKQEVRKVISRHGGQEHRPKERQLREGNKEMENQSQATKENRGNSVNLDQAVTRGSMGVLWTFSEDCG